MEYGEFSIGLRDPQVGLNSKAIYWIDQFCTGCQVPIFSYEFEDPYIFPKIEHQN